MEQKGLLLTGWQKIVVLGKKKEKKFTQTISEANK